MNRPKGKLEKFVFKDLWSGFYVLGIMVWVGSAGVLSIWLVGGGLKFFICLALIVGLEYLVGRAIFSLAHRWEFPYWYKKQHAREITIGFRGLNPITKRKLFSLHQLNSGRHNPLALRDLDRPY